MPPRVERAGPGRTPGAGNQCSRLHALRLQKNEKFTEAWPLLAMLSELLGHAIAIRENLLPERRP
jgi:hypothetical protein